MRSRRAWIAAAAGGLVIIAVAYSVMPPKPLPAVTSIAGLATRKWHSIEGDSPMSETDHYEINGMTPDQVDALLRKEFKLPEGEKHWMVRRKATFIGHHKDLPEGVQGISIGNGFDNKVVNVSVYRRLSWARGKLLRLTVPELRDKYGVVDGNPPPHLDFYDRPLRPAQP